MRGSYLAVTTILVFSLSAFNSVRAEEDIYINNIDSETHYASGILFNVRGGSYWIPYIDYTPDNVYLRSYELDGVTMHDEAGATFDDSTGSWSGYISAPIGDPTVAKRFQLRAQLFSGGSSGALDTAYVYPWVNPSGGGSGTW